MYAVETTDLTKDYLLGFWRKRPKRALDGLNLQVEKGEVFGLLGPNGAGKTTTLKILLRLVAPTSGSARLLGQELSDISVHHRIGFLPEQPSFYDHLTAEEFLSYVGDLFGLPAATRRERVDQLSERTGIAESRRVPLRKFSKGMLQRVGIAQALMNDPELVFLDEPMSGLDPLGRREVRDLILELKGRGKTVFFSTHILSDAETLCDHVAILNRGRLQGCGELRDILRMEVATTEVVLEEVSAPVLEELRRLSGAVVHTGERVRLEIPTETDVVKVLEIALRNRLKVVSVNPIKCSLEDYFLARVGAEPRSVGDREKVSVSGG